MQAVDNGGPEERSGSGISRRGWDFEIAGERGIREGEAVQVMETSKGFKRATELPCFCV